MSFFLFQFFRVFRRLPGPADHGGCSHRNASSEQANRAGIRVFGFSICGANGRPSLSLPLFHHGAAQKDTFTKSLARDWGALSRFCKGTPRHTARVAAASCSLPASFLLAACAWFAIPQLGFAAVDAWTSCSLLHMPLSFAYFFFCFFCVFASFLHAETQKPAAHGRRPK
jgi:hypothetical protein